VAVTQPVVDLYGRNLTVFSASKVGTLETLIFLGLLIVAVPLVLTIVDAVASLFGRVVHEAFHLVLVWPMMFLISLLVCRTTGLSLDAIVYPLCIVSATASTWLYATRSALRAWVSWLSVVSVVSAATFVVQAWPLFRSQEPPVADASVGRGDVPVLMVVLDEMPLYPLLDRGGDVNAKRFPAFARLQREGTWYRDTLAVSNFTHEAIPAIFASEFSHPNAIPAVGEYPRNLFTLLGGVLDVDATEPVTSLCPRSVCPTAAEVSGGVDPERLRDFLLDAATVYALRVLPEATRSRLPDTAQGWAGFVDVEGRMAATSGTYAQLDAIVDGARRLTGTTAADVSIVHALVPHFPWFLTPNGQRAARVAEVGRNSLFVDDARFTYQRMLYQTAAVDAALGEAFALMDEAGIWDDALVVVAADHGVSFQPGADQRNSDLSDPAQVADLYRVPLFVKYPDQRAAVTSDCPATNMDIVPTIAAVLEVESDWTFEGRSLVADCPERPARVVRSAQGGTLEIAGGFADLMERVDFYDSLVPAVGDIRSVASVGRSAPLIGSRVIPNGPIRDDIIWRLEFPGLYERVTLVRGEPSPAILTGGVVGDFAAGDELIVLIDGVAAGVMSVGERSGVIGLGAVLDFGIFDTEGASHEVSLVLHRRDGTLSLLGPPAS
jgi:hypothetical protein